MDEANIIGLAGMGHVNLRTWLREFFSLKSAERRISLLSLADRIDIRIEIESATGLMREAERHRLSERRAELAKQALQRLIVATAAARLKMSSSIPVEWPDFAEAFNILADLPGLDRHNSVLAYVRGNTLPPVLNDPRFARLADLFAFLERQVDTRTPRDFRVMRWLRAGALVLLLVCCGWFVISPTNLARGKYVTSSSQCGDIPAPPLGSPQLARAVDGVRSEKRFAVCTNREQEPWITIDLGALYSIQKVVVYPRSDGFWGIDDVPIRIRLSRDDEHFSDVGKRKVPMASDFPWHLKVGGKKARYVQLTAATQQPQQLIINEIEVYGR
jgi:hypothetical protein